MGLNFFNFIGIEDTAPDVGGEQVWVYDYYSDYDADYRYNGLHAPLPLYQDMDYRELPGGRHYYQTKFGQESDLESQDTMENTVIQDTSIR